MSARYLELVEPRGAVPALDGVRGVAILMVVLFHAAEPFRSSGRLLLPLAGVDLSAPLRFGWMGVNLFFVLSGFLITRQLLRHREELASMPGVGRYLARRWLRIVPLYLTVLFITVFQFTPGHFVSGHNLRLRVGYHLLFLQDYLPSDILGPFWSLGVEEKFYLVMPVILLALLALKLQRRQLALLATLACAPLLIRLFMELGVNGPVSGFDFAMKWRSPFHMNLDALLMGVLAAWIVHWRGELPPAQADGLAWPLRAAGGVLFGIVVGASLLLEQPARWERTLQQPLLALAMGVWILGVTLERTGAQSILESRWLARAGRLAYAWYLSHILIQWWLLDGGTPAGDHPGAAFLSFLPTFLGFSLLAALVLHFTVEKPFLILKAQIGASRLHAVPVHGVLSSSPT